MRATLFLLFLFFFMAASNALRITIYFLNTSFLNLHSVCVYLLLFTVRLQQRSVTLFAVAPLSFSLSLTLPQTLPFSQRQNKLIRSEVRAYQWGISIQIKTLSGHKQQEAKQDPSAAEWEDGRGKETRRETERVWEPVVGRVNGGKMHCLANSVVSLGSLSYLCAWTTPCPCNTKLVLFCIIFYLYFLMLVLNLFICEVWFPSCILLTLLCY